MSLTIQLDGLDPAASPYARFSWTRAAVQWADMAGPMVREALKHEAPVARTTPDGRKGGRLRDSIRYERETGAASLTMIFTANTPYAKYVIEGTGPHVIRASAARYLHFYDLDTGQDVFARSVQHPGTKPNDFPERAVGGLAAVKLKEWFADAVQASMEGL